MIINAILNNSKNKKNKKIIYHKFLTFSFKKLKPGSLVSEGSGIPRL